MAQNPPRNAALDNYVPVAERIEKFYDRYKDGRILTSIVDHDRETGFVLVRAEVYRTGDDATPAATGHAYEYKDAGYVQRGSYIEVAETSAVGRALAFLNFETKRGIASREEMEKFAAATTAAAPQSKRSEETTASERSAGDEGAREATRARLAAVAPAAAPAARPTTERNATSGSRAAADTAATEDQKEEILILLEEIYPNDRRAQKRALTEGTGKQSRDDLTQTEARRLIAELKKRAIP
jgi:hypothetical protein